MIGNDAGPGSSPGRHQGPVGTGIVMAEDSTPNGAGSGGRGRWRLLLPVLLLGAIATYAVYAIRPVGPDDAAPRRADAPAPAEERAARTGDAAAARDAAASPDAAVRRRGSHPRRGPRPRRATPAPDADVDVAAGPPAPALFPSAGAPGALPPVPRPAGPGGLGAAVDAPPSVPAIADDPQVRRRAPAAEGAGTEAADVSDTKAVGAPPPDPGTMAAPDAAPPPAVDTREQGAALAPDAARPGAGKPAEAPGTGPAPDTAPRGGTRSHVGGRQEGRAATGERGPAPDARADAGGQAEVASVSPPPEEAGTDPAADAGTVGAPAPAPAERIPFDTALPAPDAPAAAPRTPAEATPPGRAVVTPDRAPAPAPGDVTAPSFDVVRIDAGGSGLVAGRAEPGATVKVLAGDLVLATVEAGRSGEFVAFVQIPAGDEGQVLRLLAETGRAAARSAEEILVLPPPAATRAPAAPEAAPAIVRAETGSETVRVERPSALGKVDGVTIDAISYDEAGEVKLSGRAPGARPIRIYLDDAPAGAVRASEAGLWEARVEGVAEGRYTLRVDALNPDGSVESRAETPFQRVYPTAEQRARPARIIVQPGNTLWVMARERYGRGILYTQIYLANQEAIRDPDLIYPGQIFDIPVEDEFVR